jgi:uncharacterized protein YjiS (DUF1127 family)
MIRQGTRFVDHAIRMKRDRAKLEQMPDHILKDIGISRSEILFATGVRQDLFRR